MCSSNSHGTGIFPRFGCEEKSVWLAVQLLEPPSKEYI